MITKIKADKSPINPIFDTYMAKISTLDEIKQCKDIADIDGLSVKELEAF